MISETDFLIAGHRTAAMACRNLRPGVASDAEIAEITALCENERMLCLVCEDGMMCVELRPFGSALELFVWIAVSFRHGAVKRQEDGLRSIARELGAQTIAFQSRRRGWARRLPHWYKRGIDEFYRDTDG